MESYSYLHLGLFLPARRPPEQTNKQKTHAALEGFTWDIELSAKSRPMHPVVSPSSPQFDLASACCAAGRRAAPRALAVLQCTARVARSHTLSWHISDWLPGSTQTENPLTASSTHLYALALISRPHNTKQQQHLIIAWPQSITGRQSGE
jgi:hypothetical protein